MENPNRNSEKSIDQFKNESVQGDSIKGGGAPTSMGYGDNGEVVDVYTTITFDNLDGTQSNSGVMDDGTVIDSGYAADGSVMP